MELSSCCWCLFPKALVKRMFTGDSFLRFGTLCLLVEEENGLGRNSWSTGAGLEGGVGFGFQFRCLNLHLSASAAGASGLVTALTLGARKVNVGN